MNIIILLLISFLSGIAEAIMDTLNFRFKSSIFRNLNPKFWDKDVSSVNKNRFKDKNQISHLIYSTFLSFVTDAWHLFKSLHTVLLFILVIMSFIASNCNIYLFVTYLLSAYLFKKLVFEVGYNYIFNKK